MILIHKLNLDMLKMTDLAAVVLLNTVYIISEMMSEEASVYII